MSLKTLKIAGLIRMMNPYLLFSLFVVKDCLENNLQDKREYEKKRQ